MPCYVDPVLLDSGPDNHVCNADTGDSCIIVMGKAPTCETCGTPCCMLYSGEVQQGGQQNTVNSSYSILNNDVCDMHTAKVNLQHCLHTKK